MSKNILHTTGAILFVIGSLLFIAAGLVIKHSNNAIYTVTFDTDGGTSVKSVEVKSMNKLNLKEETTTRSGYTFKGWVNEDGIKVQDELEVNSNMKLTAIWEKIEEIIYYDVTFDLGDKVEQVKVKKGEKIALVSPGVKEGYVFKYWEDKDKNKITDDYKVEGDITFYAVWEKIKTADEKAETKGEEEKVVKYTCPDGYTLETDKCIKEEKVSPKEELKCPEGFEPNGTTCVNKNDTKEKVTVCNDVGDYKNGIYSDALNGCFYNEIKLDEVDENICTNENGGNFYKGKCYGAFMQGEEYYGSSCPTGYMEITKDDTSLCAKEKSTEKVYFCNNDFEKVISGNDVSCVKRSVLEAIKN